MRAAGAGAAVRAVEETERADSRDTADSCVALLEALGDLCAAGGIARRAEGDADGVVARRIDPRASRAAAGAIGDGLREVGMGAAWAAAAVAGAAVRALQETGRAEAGHARHSNLTDRLALRDVSAACVVARSAEGHAASIQRSQGSAAAASTTGRPSVAAARARECHRTSHRPSHASHTVQSHARPLGTAAGAPLSRGRRRRPRVLQHPRIVELSFPAW
jgi:hypothetical protein